jgi:uncharacterized protein YbjT (DUF2867 family)
MDIASRPLILITGATGYVGGRLVPRMLESDYRVRVMVRDKARLKGRPWLNQVEVVLGDVLRPDSLAAAAEGAWAAYYLIRNMNVKDDPGQRELGAARNFGQACRLANVERIIYVGALVDPEARLPEHVRFRQCVGGVLRESGVPVTEFQAAVIVGSGSLAFEMIRYLTELVPVMICPRWVETRVQPIAVRNLLAYLIAALEKPDSTGQIIEVGGGDVLMYKQMLMQYAQERGLRRGLIQVPFLTPRLSAYWIHWMTPVPAAIARRMIEGFRSDAIVRDYNSRRLFPEIKPLTYRQAVRSALAHLEACDVETTWSDALATTQGDAMPAILRTIEGMLVEQRQQIVSATPPVVYQSYSRIGGDRGWLCFNWAWRLRGILDRLVGGVGFRRGRRDPDELRVGDALDFWRVEAVEPGRLLRLRAEMKVPGLAWLQFEAKPLQESKTLLVQTAIFAPKGLAGLLYWYGMYPIHGPIFSGMIRELASEAESNAV